MGRASIAKLILLIAAAAAGGARGEEISFEKQIAPLLEARCLFCHDTAKKQGEFDLSTSKGLLEGGEEGVDVVPGKPDSSSLLAKISGAKPKMPKEGKPFTAEQVALLRTWIEQGAKWPEGYQLERKNVSGPKFWAYQPVLRPKIPAPAPQADAPRAPENWIRTPVDAFILEKLYQKKLAPAPEADRRAQIRRLTFDLHGLPPTPEEVDAFSNDKNPDAYEKLVDRLLASPRYGERWARHWLDVAHYGETHGYDKDYRRDRAWPYRDYVIRAFNDDKPYSRFIKEQLAGDVFWPDTSEGIIATGFIAAGPWDHVGQTESKAGSVDLLNTQLLDRDDMVSNTAAAFMSMTVYCARCHDHKFDPIPQRDYYSLQAVFAGLYRTNLSFNETRQQRLRRAELKRRGDELKAQRDKLVQSINDRKSPELDPIDAELRELNQKVLALQGPQDSAVSSTNGWHSQFSGQKENTKWVQVDLGKSVPIDEIRLIPAWPVDYRDLPGFGFPQRFKIEISDDDKFFLHETIDDKTAADFPNPGDTAYVVKPQNKSARFVRVTVTHLYLRDDVWIFALSELQVGSGGKNAALGMAVTSSDTIEAGRWSTRHLVDGFSSRLRLPEYPQLAAQPNETQESRKEKVRTEIKTLKEKITQKEAQRKERAQQLASADDRMALEKIDKELAQTDASLKALPAEELVYTVVPHAPRQINLLHRGDVRQPEAEVAPGALSVVRAIPSQFKLDNPADEGARRAALANWITDPANVLTRRSIVNRIWHYHFGKGIVDTPNDFGFNGGRPTHPELLDWLAVEFLESGESFKKLHKLIVTSAAYRQACVNNPAYEKVDADNRLLWRAPRRRLDAETIRDSMLYASGKLNLTMYGPGYDLFSYTYDYSPKYDYAAFTKAEHPETWRRTVYRFITRSVPNPFLECLDCADPNLNVSVRNATNTALQALAVLNDPFIIRQSRYLAEKIEKSTPDKSAQIELLYKIALCRLPAAAEKTMLQEYIGKHGLANACRLLLNTNEFLFVE